MLSQLDRTHDPKLRSWVADSNGHPEFPLQNLPFGTFRMSGQPAEAGIAIGAHILALARVHGEHALAAYSDDDARLEGRQQLKDFAPHFRQIVFSMKADRRLLPLRLHRRHVSEIRVAEKRAAQFFEFRG